MNSNGYKFLASILGLISFLYAFLPNIANSSLIIGLHYTILLVSLAQNSYVLCKERKVGLYILFQASLFLFIYNRILFNCLAGDWLGLTDGFPGKALSKDTVQRLLFLLLGLQFLLFIGYTSKPQVKPLRNSKQDNTQKLILGYSLIIFFIITPIYLIKSNIKLQAVKSATYVDIHTGLEVGLIYPWYTMGAGLILTSAFSLITAMQPRKLIVIIVFVLFFLLLMFDTLRGQRVVIGMSFAYFLWYFFYHYNMDVSLKGVFILILGLFSFIFFLMLVRVGFDFSVMSFGSIYDFLYNQSVSIYVPGTMLQYDNYFEHKSYPYIIHPIIMIFNKWQGQSQDMIDSYNALPDELSYFINKEAYLSGYGYGSSFLGDLIDLGFLSTLILVYGVGWFIKWFELNYESSEATRVLGYSIICNLIAMPRFEMLFMIRNGLIIFTVYICAKLFAVYARNSIFNLNRYFPLKNISS